MSKCAGVSGKTGVIEKSGEANSEKSLLLCIPLPYWPEIFKVSKRGLKSSKYCCKSDFSTEFLKIISSSYDDLCEITELSWSKNDLTTRICSKVVPSVSSSISFSLSHTCLTIENSSFPAFALIQRLPLT